MNTTQAEVKDVEARGVKRTADDSLDDDQRFAKRFDLLNLGACICNWYTPDLSH